MSIEVKERQQVRTRRLALGMSGSDLDIAAGLAMETTLRFERGKRPVKGKAMVLYNRLMDALAKERAQRVDYGELIDEWMTKNGATYRQFAKVIGISAGHLMHLRREGLMGIPRTVVRRKLEAFFAEWHQPKAMDITQRKALRLAEERWKMIEADAAARVLIDFYDPTDDELAEVAA